MRIGLSLGAGGPNGWAHLGVLRALEERGIDIHLINGSSIGAIVGGGYAVHRNTDKMLSIAEKIVRSVNAKYFNIFRYATESQSFLSKMLLGAACDVAALRHSLLSHKLNLKVLDWMFGDLEFHQTKIPFSSVVVDILSMETVSITKGKLADGLLPSIAIPGIFPPVEIEGRILVDGGALSWVPVRELRRQGADFVIAVDLDEKIERTYRNGFDILNYIDSLKFSELTKWELAEADFQITVDTSHLCSNRFDNYEDATSCGYETAKRVLSDLERKLHEAWE
jgi:NTE family protein